ncbi:MAG TPA: anhydro-N-acetylmuramic acid kinase [Bauldia sp.]|nr:anhydro-N-acetylmuramic acid kinase [Bauldia sp.]
MRVLGLMSGTSMDGVDAAVLETDGQQIGAFGPHLFRPYTESERAVLRAALADAAALSDRAARPGRLAEAERIITDAHAQTVERLRAENGGIGVELVGFHGQTVFHAPERHLTVQIGDGVALARRVGLPVVCDFRAADVAAGGQGAPLVPVYHRALFVRTRFSGSMAVVNIGGVANVTRVGADGSLTAGDTGPGNALLDDFIRARTGAAMDSGGAIAARGVVDDAALDSLLADKWFAQPFPKSLDRNAFSAAPVAGLSTENGAATLAAFTSRTIVKGIVMAGGADRIVVAGGGASNPVLMKRIAGDAGISVVGAAELGWSPDFLEAEAFAFLAARSVRGLPLTFPGTTGVPAPTTGGVTVRP